MAIARLISLIPAVIKYGPLLIQTAQQIHDSPLVREVEKDQNLDVPAAAEKVLSWLAKPGEMSEGDHDLFSRITGFALSRLRDRVAGGSSGGSSGG